MGGTLLTPNGKEIVARHGLRYRSAPRESPGDLDKQIGALFSGLSNDLDAWRALSARYSGNLFVGLFLSGFNEGLCFSPTTTREIGLRGLELGLDIYSSHDIDHEIV